MIFGYLKIIRLNKHHPDNPEFRDLSLSVMQTSSGSYYEDYMRTQAFERATNTETKRLLTDRNAYISYLEIQLEKVSAACLNSQSLEKKMNTLQGTVRSMEEQISNISRIAKMTQSFAEQETTKNAHTLVGLTTKVDAHENSIDKCWQDVRYLREREHAVEDRLKESELRVQNEISTAVQNTSKSNARVEERYEQLHSQLLTQDSRLNTLTTTQNDTRGALTTVEARTREYIGRVSV